MSGPGDDLRSAWTGIVAPEDYEAHMQALGYSRLALEPREVLDGKRTLGLVFETRARHQYSFQNEYER